MGSLRSSPVVAFRVGRWFAVLAATCVVAVGCSGNDSTPTSAGGVVDTVSATTATPTETTTTNDEVATSLVAPDPVMLPLQWTQVPSVTDFEHAWMAGVAEMNSGYVAVGALVGDDDRADPAVWLSDDGIEWKLVDPGALEVGVSAPSTEDEFIADVDATSDKVVAVGSEGTYWEEGTIGDYDAAVWVSDDGAAWTRIPHNESVFGGPGIQIMRTVIATSVGWVAAGESDLSGSIWYSPEASDWTLVPPSMLAPDGETFAVADLATHDGTIVAVGYSPGFDDGRVYYLMASSLDGFSPRAWTSTDGLTWSPAAVEAAEDPGAIMESVTVTEDGTLIAVGHTESGIVVWTSMDGTAWEAVDTTIYSNWLPDEPWAPSIAAWNDSLVIVGDCLDTACALGSLDDGVTWDDIGPTAGYPDAIEDISSMYWHRQFFLQNNDVLTTETMIMVVGMSGAGSGDTGRVEAAVFLGS